jgi:pimeloyl-ACP methyl ester carboxylesterase
VVDVYSCSFQVVLMAKLTSDDGTTIGFERTGDGPALVLVDGALCHRGLGPSSALAEALASEFTVFSYDRRGRGESGDTQPYEVSREVEDLAAVIMAAGGPALVYGISSGGVLALEATAAGLPIDGLALFEPPFTGEFSDPRTVVEEHARLDGLIAARRNGEALEAFLSYMMPPEAVAEMRATPAWPALEAATPTLRYDHAVLGDGTMPRARLQMIEVPTLVIAGSESPDVLQQAAGELAKTVPGASVQTLEGESHTSEPDQEITLLRDFFLSPAPLATMSGRHAPGSSPSRDGAVGSRGTVPPR